MLPSYRPSLFLEVFMFKRKVVRLIIAGIFDQLNNNLLILINEAVDAEIEERGL